MNHNIVTDDDGNEHQAVDGLEVSGNNFKVNALCGSPDMVLFACERIIQLKNQIKSLIQTHRDNSGYEPSLSVFQREIDIAENLITRK